MSDPLQQQDDANAIQFSPFIPDKPFPISFNPEDLGQTQVQEDPKINREESLPSEPVKLSNPLQLQEDTNNAQFSPITPDESFPISFNPEDFGQTQVQENPNLQNTIENEERKINQMFDQPESSQFKFPTPLIIRDPGLNSIGMPKDGKDHPCYRVCKPWDRRTCYYKFHVEWYHAMSKACMDCPRNPAHCDNPDCVPANGVGRTITVVNRKMPGPAIEVSKNKTFKTIMIINAKVINKIITDIYLLIFILTSIIM